jgi:hypothetical protein
MRFRLVQTAKLDRLDRQLESAHAVTVALFREVMEIASERLSILRRAGKTAHIERSLAAGACTEAALALLELEMPNWTDPAPRQRRRRMALLVRLPPHSMKGARLRALRE